MVTSSYSTDGTHGVTNLINHERGKDWIVNSLNESRLAVRAKEMELWVKYRAMSNY